MSIRSLLSPPTDVKGLGAVISLMLAAVGLVLITAVLERRTRLDSLQRHIEAIEAGLQSNASYLADADAVRRALTAEVNAAVETILALGARSSAASYLNAIEDAVTRRGVTYYRVLDGDEISHSLHEHLLRLLEGGRGSTFVAWTRKEKYGNLTATEKSCVIAFPSPFPDKLAGLHLVGVGLAAQYGQQVLAVYGSEESERVTSIDLEALCERCRPSNDW
ncbi:hypothetical protein ACI799_08000 [Blastococcus sp. SYSU DS0753]